MKKDENKVKVKLKKMKHKYQKSISNNQWIFQSALAWFFLAMCLLAFALYLV